MNETTPMSPDSRGPTHQSGSSSRAPVWARIARMGGRSLASIADQGASAAITFISSVFVGRLIGAEALGLFAMTSVLVMAMRQLQVGAVLDPMSVFGPRRSEAERSGYLGFLVATQLLWIGGITALIAIGAFVWEQIGKIDQIQLRIIIASLIFANMVTFQYLMRRQFYVEQMPFQAFIQSISYLVLSCIGLEIYRLSDNVTIVGMYLVLCLCSILICSVQGVRLSKQVRSPTESERKIFVHDHWTYGRWILLSVPVGIAYYQGYFLLCGALLTAEQTGFLKAADSLVSPFTQVAIGLSLMFVPMISRRIDDMSSASRNAFAVKLLAGMMAISTVYAAIAFFFGHTIIHLTFGDKLAAAGPVLQTMAIIPLCVGFALPPGVMLAAHRRSDLRFYANAAAAVVTFAVGIPLILEFGMRGATWGMCLSQATQALGLWGALFYLRRRHAVITENASGSGMGAKAEPA